MPTVYDRGSVPELKGAVDGGLAVVVHDPEELRGFQRLLGSVAALPGDPLSNLYRVVATAGPSLATWPAFTTPPAPPATMADSPRPNAVPDWRESGSHAGPAAAFDAALGLTYEAWSRQGDDIDELACAMMLPRPGRRLRFESRRPSLTLDYGSVRARALAAGARLREFGVALFPVARSRRQTDLVEALRARASGRPLPRLELLQPEQLDSKAAVVIFLHGLIATDVGTFDGFVDLLRAQPWSKSLLLTAWPHDTLDKIKLNARMLAEVIQRKVGATALPIVFVCHSRGGLVARRTAVELIKANPLWRSRLLGAVTFGTPHDGAELAEKGDRMLGKLLLLRATGQGAGVVPLVDALWAVRQFRKLPGITDLRPRKNGGKFLTRLCAAESRLAAAPGGLPMPIYAVGGNTQVNGTTGWLTERFFRGAPNDLVVTLASTAPEHWPQRAETTSDHFGYFRAAETQKKHAAAAVAFLHQALSTSRAQAAARRVDAPAQASHRHATRSLRKGAMAMV